MKLSLQRWGWMWRGWFKKNYGDVLYRWLNAGCSEWLNNNWTFPWYLFLAVQSRIIWWWTKQAKSEDSILCDLLTPHPGCIVHLRCGDHRCCDWKWPVTSRTVDAGRILWAIKYKSALKARHEASFSTFQIQAFVFVSRNRLAVLSESTF